MTIVETATTLMNGCQGYCEEYSERGNTFCMDKYAEKKVLCPSCKSIIKAKRECWQEELKDNLELKEELKEKIQELFKGSQYFEGCRDWNILIIRYLDERIEELKQALKIMESVQ